MLKKICEELGVEIGEEWRGSDDKDYIIEGDGSLLESTLIGVIVDDIRRVLRGDLKPVWKPRQDERCYTPFITIHEADRFISRNWEDNDTNNWYLKNNMVFKTKEEAIKATNKLIELYKEDK